MASAYSAILQVVVVAVVVVAVVFVGDLLRGDSTDAGFRDGIIM